MNKRAPGPWMTYGRHVITGNPIGPIDARTIDDAHLVAAAPELLANLERLLAWIDHTSIQRSLSLPDEQYLEAARVVIRRARGEEGK